MNSVSNNTKIIRILKTSLAALCLLTFADVSARALIGLDYSVMTGNTVQIVGTGPSAEAATEDASRGAVDFVASRTELSRRDAYMLLGIVGDVRIGTSPRPVMAARVIIDKDVLSSAGWNGEVLRRAG